MLNRFFSLATTRECGIATSLASTFENSFSGPVITLVVFRLDVSIRMALIKLEFELTREQIENGQNSEKNSVNYVASTRIVRMWSKRILMSKQRFWLSDLGTG